MQFDEVLRRRRMVRNYTGEPVPREVIERVVKQARRAPSAPSAGFSQGVRMVVVTDPETRKRIAGLADEAYYLERGYEPWDERRSADLKRRRRPLDEVVRWERW